MPPFATDSCPCQPSVKVLEEMLPVTFVPLTTKPTSVVPKVEDPVPPLLIPKMPLISLPPRPMEPLYKLPKASLRTLPATSELMVVEPLTVKLVTLVVAKVAAPVTFSGPVTVRAVEETPTKVASPETFKVDCRTTGPEVIRFAIVVVASVEVPLTKSVPPRFKLVNEGEATTAMVEVPDLVMLEPAVIKSAISL